MLVKKALVAILLAFPLIAFSETFEITEEELNELSTIIETQQNQLTAQKTELTNLSELLTLQATLLTDQKSNLTNLSESMNLLDQQLTLSQVDLEQTKNSLVEQATLLSESVLESQQIEKDLKTFQLNLAINQWIERGIWAGVVIITYFVGGLLS